LWVYNKDKKDAGVLHVKKQSHFLFSGSQQAGACLLATRTSLVSDTTTKEKGNVSF
jgi:hypothetical protein